MMSVGPQVERLEDQVAPKRSKTTRRSGPPSEVTIHIQNQRAETTPGVSTRFMPVAKERGFSFA
jgi:hypothetical protein